MQSEHIFEVLLFMQQLIKNGLAECDSDPFMDSDEQKSLHVDMFFFYGLPHGLRDKTKII